MKAEFLPLPYLSLARTARPARKNGFTLPELLVVVTIIAVLAAIAIPVSQNIRKSAQSATCVSNLKQVGAAIIEYAVDNNNKLPGLSPIDPATRRRSSIWPEGVARAGYLWGTPNKGRLPCGTGVWTCPSCDFMSDAFGGYGVAESTVFQYDQLTAEGGVTGGSLRLTEIDDPANTWLVGDAAQKPSTPKKGWYGIWANPADWKNSHCPAGRHGGKSNVCMVDGHVESLTTKQIADRKLTYDVVRR